MWINSRKVNNFVVVLASVWLFSALLFAAFPLLCALYVMGHAAAALFTVTMTLSAMLFTAWMLWGSFALACTAAIAYIVGCCGSRIMHWSLSILKLDQGIQVTGPHSATASAAPVRVPNCTISSSPPAADTRPAPDSRPKASIDRPIATNASRPSTATATPKPVPAPCVSDARAATSSRPPADTKAPTANSMSASPAATVSATPAAPPAAIVSAPAASTSISATPVANVSVTPAASCTKPPAASSSAPPAAACSTEWFAYDHPPLEHKPHMTWHTNHASSKDGCPCPLDDDTCLFCGNSFIPVTLSGMAQAVCTCHRQFWRPNPAADMSVLIDPSYFGGATGSPTVAEGAPGSHQSPRAAVSASSSPAVVQGSNSTSSTTPAARTPAPTPFGNSSNANASSNKCLSTKVRDSCPVNSSPAQRSSSSSKGGSSSKCDAMPSSNGPSACGTHQNSSLVADPAPPVAPVKINVPCSRRNSISIDDGTATPAALTPQHSLARTFSAESSCPGTPAAQYSTNNSVNGCFSAGGHCEPCDASCTVKKTAPAKPSQPAPAAASKASRPRPTNVVVPPVQRPTQRKATAQAAGIKATAQAAGANAAAGQQRSKRCGPQRTMQAADTNAAGTAALASAGQCRTIQLRPRGSFSAPTASSKRRSELTAEQRSASGSRRSRLSSSLSSSAAAGRQGWR